MTKRETETAPRELAWIARTPAGARQCLKGREAFGGELYFHKDLPARDDAHHFGDSGVLLRDLYGRGVTTIAAFASGLVVRCLAPALRDKHDEPPVLVIDERGRFVIPLLGGHRGGNDFARRVAEVLGGEAVITTASEFSLGVALDEPPRGWTLLNSRDLASFTMGLLGGACLRLSGAAEGAEWLSGIPNLRDAGDAKNTLTIHANEWSELVRRPREMDGKTLLYGVGELSLGLGASKDCPGDEMNSLVRETLEGAGIPTSAVGVIATWDGKENEPAIVNVNVDNKGDDNGGVIVNDDNDGGDNGGVVVDVNDDNDGDDNGGVIVNVNKKTFYTFSSASLEQQTAKISSGSAVVKQITGSPSVAEAAALAALGNESRLLLPKRKSKAATCAVAVASPLVSATPPLPASQNKNFDNGLLAVIGLGPGAPEWCNYETLTLLAETEHWIGYHGYLTRLLPRAGTRRLHGFALGEEQERAALAIRLARHGHKAALISSGDPGIYAMASPLFEMLDEDKTADMPHIVVAPGISAVQATAARLGAPLGHDFCAISLSDLLTPPETIRKRLRAAAEADFVIALYNPASEERRSLLREAIQIIGDHRSADTRAVVARAVGHHNEKITNTTLGCIRADEVDMRCLVLIGNAGTRQVGRWLYTPRGYGAKR